jgi:50S ribosomal protein L16 3-hydroxylase
LLGGLSPAQFMRRHWQRKPLLVRQAWPGVRARRWTARAVRLAGSDEVESRLVVPAAQRLDVRHGPLPRRVLPPLKQPLDAAGAGRGPAPRAAHALLQRLPLRARGPAGRPDGQPTPADGGGVGPHFDSYDVFLLQVHGKRRWRIGR